MGKGLIEPWHIVILILVIGVLFGWKKLPDAAGSLGRSMRIFRSEVEELKKDRKATPGAASTDTVKGETGHPSADPIPDPTSTEAADPVRREKHDQSPACTA